MSEWNEVRFDEIGDVYSGGTPSTSNPEYWDGDIAFITPYDLSTNKTPYIKKTQRYITQKGLEKSSSNLLPANSLILSSRAPIGYIVLSYSEFVTNQGCKSLRFFEKQDPLFHFYNLHMYVDEMKRFGVGTTFSEISKGDLSKLKIQIPKKIEVQQRIAKILSTCDKVIEQTEAAIDKYKAIKQGLLHDLFTRGLDAKGHLRPTFQNAPELYKESELGMIPKEWEVKRLEEIGGIIAGGTPSTSNAEYWDGTIPFVTPFDLSQCTSAYITQTSRKITELGLERSSANLLPNNSLVISKRAPIGYVALIDIESVTNQGCISLSFFSDQFPLFHYYNIHLYINEMKKFGVGTTFSEISKRDISKLKIKTPILYCEQVEITKRISKMDNNILSEKTILKKYQSIKKGLMGDLLGGKVSV